MRAISSKAEIRVLAALLAGVAAVGGSAQAPVPAADPSIVVNGMQNAGPELKGVISARTGDRIKVTADDGTVTTVALNDATRIRGASGFLGLNRTPLMREKLVNGLPVTIKTWAPTGAAGGDLIADRISFRSTDLKLANMIRTGTAQRFAEVDAATEALRGRVGDIDKYNIKGTTNVHFATGKAELSAEDKAGLCATATSAQGTENALLLVVGYTDSTGGDDLNQALSEKRAARVINYLQQVCHWKPYRMLTPTGMAKADPLASNDTEEGKAQNRRVAVNILVSKSVDGL